MKASVKGAAEVARPDGADVGSRLRSLRQLYGFSQRELARRSGVTNAMISMIEQNQVSPSIASLRKLLRGFGLSLSEFFAEEPSVSETIFYRTDEFLRLGTDPGVVLRQVGRGEEGRKLQVLHETYEPGGDTGSDMLGHEGEEAGVVIRGHIEITVGGRTQVLGPGDGYYFQSRLPHRFRNIGDEVCELVSVCTPPTF